MVYSGDAIPSSGDIEFNRVDDAIGLGHARYADAVQIWDRKSGKLSDFTTHFTFIIIDTQCNTVYGDGFAFFLAPVGFEIPLNSTGSFLGLFNTTTDDSPESQMIVVEFDTFVNDWDPPFAHVGINRNSIRSAVYTFWNATLHSGMSADAWISYNGTTQMLSLSWRYSAENTSREMTTHLSYRVDLREALPEKVTIGFSGASSSFGERHILRYWEFNSTLDLVGEIPNLPKVMPVPMYLAALGAREVSSVGASMTAASINLPR
ncbi:hypothetical protein L6452_31940 [Arctium lappa]|uniref:Uncharacterized protein n=1 Tax=Arctium lappa TaxID=4217 RepID=A0ACB8Z3T5_ARCLA|nr:hypothetical protein L6452_31940 [Arctium lappa]